MLAVWASWLTALQGWLAARGSEGFPGRWVPDLSLVFLVACAARFRGRDVPLAAFLLALARIGASVEPPSAILAGFLCMGLALRGLRRAMEVNGPFVRSGVAAGCAWAFATWLILVHETRAVALAGGQALAAPDGVTSAWVSAAPVGRIALATALASLLFGPALAHLPGLTPLRRRGS